MARPKQAPTLSLTFLDELIQRFLDLEQQIDALKATKEKISSQLRVALEVSADHAIDAPSGSARLVSSDVVTYDFEALEQEVPAEVLRLISHCQIDRELAEASATLGTLPAAALDRARRVIKRRPQLRVRGPARS